MDGDEVEDNDKKELLATVELSCKGNRKIYISSV
jgi:hypothetical protein